MVSFKNTNKLVPDMAQVLDEKLLQATRDLDVLFAFFYHPLRTAGYDLISLVTRGRILDVGCGAGGLIRRLQNYNSNAGANGSVYGVDVNPHHARIAHAQTKGKVIIADAVILPFPDRFLDLVISITLFTNVLSDKEYKPIQTKPWSAYTSFSEIKERRILQEAFRVLKKGCLYLMFQEPRFMDNNSYLESFLEFGFQVIYPKALKPIYRNGFRDGVYILRKE